MPFSVESPSGNPLLVTYEPPQVVAGEPPLKTTCTPASGTSVFPLGTTQVTCNVVDSVGRTGMCTFAVTVIAPLRLTVTRFMAFGNSITEGKTAFGRIENGYPAQLEALLRARYTAQAQAISVVNKGFGGEDTIAGAARLPVELRAENPEVLLLEEGVNDLNSGDPMKVPPLVTALRDMVRTAKARGVRVLLATLLPVREGGSRAGAFPLILTTNEQIRQLAVTEGVILVDLHAGFNASPDPFIDVDGLHPTEAGYGRMAELFLAAIRSEFQTPQGPAPVFQFVRNLSPAEFR